jgi:hypothetical protein
MPPILALLCTLAAAEPSRPAEPPKAAQQASAKEKDEDESALEQMLGPEEDLEDPVPVEAPSAPKQALVAPPPAPATAAGKAAQKLGRTGEIIDEAAVGSSQPTPENPRQGQAANLVRGSLFLSDAFTLNASVLLTLEGGAPPPQGSPFQASYGGAVALASLGFDWEADDHFTLGLRGDLSPPSEQYSATTVQYQATRTSPFETVDALLRTRSSSWGGALTLGYDTAGDGDYESSVLASVTATNLTSDERLTQVQGRLGRVVSAADLRTFCRTTPTKCSKSLRAVLSDQQFSLAQVRLAGAFTETLFEDTDLTLGGEYYIYSDDPTQLGFFSVASAGRLTNLGGSGVPIAPLQWTVRPEITHRFGAFSARLWVQAGQYVDGAGQGTAAIGARLQYKFTRAFRMWVSASGQKDTDVDGNESKSGLLALGMAYRF